MELNFQVQPPVFQLQDYCYYYSQEVAAAASPAAKPTKPRGRKKGSTSHSKFVGVRQRPSGRWVAEIRTRRRRSACGSAPSRPPTPPRALRRGRAPPPRRRGAHQLRATHLAGLPARRPHPRILHHKKLKGQVRRRGHGRSRRRIQEEVHHGGGGGEPLRRSQPQAIAIAMVRVVLVVARAAAAAARTAATAP